MQEDEEEKLAWRSRTALLYQPEPEHLSDASSNSHLPVYGLPVQEDEEEKLAWRIEHEVQLAGEAHAAAQAQLRGEIDRLRGELDKGAAAMARVRADSESEYVLMAGIKGSSDCVNGPFLVAQVWAGCAGGRWVACGGS